MAKTRALRPKKKQKRGCANVPVPREEVLVAGKVPKGCRFETGGGVLCTPAVAEKHGVIEVERKKAVARKKAPKSKSAAKKTADKKKRKYCYSENSKLPYLKASLKEGKRPKLKKGCKKDPETGKICCDRPWGKRRKKAVNGLDGLSLENFGRRGLGDAAIAVAPSSSSLRAPARQPRRSSPALSLALLDDSELDAPDETALAMLDASDDFDFDPPAEALPRRGPPPQDHLRHPGDFALTWFGASALAATGVALTYEAIDRIEAYDDAPVGRAATFVGVGAVPAFVAWWLSEESQSGNTIRTVAATWGVTFTAIGVLGLIRELILKQAGDTEDPEDRKDLEDFAEHIPFYARHEHDDDPPPDEDDVDDDGEIVTDAGDDPGTSGPYPYPGGRPFR